MKHRQLLLAVSALLLGGCGIFGELDWGALIGTLKITYNLNGGGGAVPLDSNTYSKGTRVTAQSAPANGSPPTGAASFYGWSTTADGYGEFHPANSGFTIMKDTTLYALWQGDGTNANYPKLGSTKDDLKAIDRNDHFALVSDVNDMDDVIQPSSYSRFSGTFDGRGHTVTLDIHKTGDVKPRHIGLFDALFDYAEIKNLHVTGTITVEDTNTSPGSTISVGGIAGMSGMDTITMKNCMANVNITVKSSAVRQFVGALAGGADGFMAAHCYTSGTITTTNNFLQSGGGLHGAGGIAGVFGSRIGVVPGQIENMVSLTDITSVTTGHEANSGRVDAHRLFGGVNPGATNGATFTNNYGLGIVSRTDKYGPVTTTYPNIDFDGLDVTQADIEKEAWWRTTAGWESVWGGDKPTPDKPWVWDVAAKRPRLHKFD